MRINILVLGLLLSPVAQATVLDALTVSALPKNLMDLIGWIPQEEATCLGRFQKIDFPLGHVQKKGAKQQPIDVMSDQGNLAQSEDSLLVGHVKLTQGRRQVTADRATVFKNKKSLAPNHMRLSGHVRAVSPNGILVADQAQVHFKNPKDVHLNNAAYRLSHVAKARQALPGWGIAGVVDGNDHGVWTLHQATYSTCSPSHPMWQMRASELTVNQKTGWGQAKHAMLFVHAAPFLYFPYLRFPIDGRRHSGFLTPNMTFYNHGEQRYTLPYYWNIAPNYDAQLIPSADNRRGVGFEGMWRYLTPTTHGRLVLGFLPNDRAFSSFKRSGAQAQFAGKPYAEAALNQLKGFPESRYYFSVHDDRLLAPSLSSHIDFQRVSDSYLLADFGDVNGLSNTGRMPGMLSLNYTKPTLQAYFRVQHIQTLHPLTQPRIADVYSRLPQLSIAKQKRWGGVDTRLRFDWTHFWRPDDFYTHVAVPKANRLHGEVEANYVHQFRSGHWDARLRGVHAQYRVTDPQLGQADKPSLSTMMFATSGSLVFERATQIKSRAYIQTLEPKIQYLYVPYVKQSQIPLFDTNLPSFSYANLFNLNRFTGFDRVGDANQVSIGVTSRLLDPETGLERWVISLGQAFGFKQHQICLTDDCQFDPLGRSKQSPLAGLLSYTLNENWRVYGSGAWDFHARQFTSNSLGVHYTPDNRRQVQLSYHYVRDHYDLDQVTPLTSDRGRVDQLQLAAAWPLSQNWQMLLDSLYDASMNHAHSYFVGLAYHGCCWSMRLMMGKDYAGIDGNSTRVYRTRTYLQIQLDGLMGIGSSGASEWLRGALPGYHDPFA